MVSLLIVYKNNLDRFGFCVSIVFLYILDEEYVFIISDI